MNNRKPIILGTILLAVSFLVLISGSNLECRAAPEPNYYYQLIKVDITINKDSTFDVVEEQEYYLEGSFGFFYRDIELKDLDHISDIEVFDSAGKKLSKNEYQISYKDNRMGVRWDFPRKNFSNELKSWTVKYKVHGALGFYDDWDELYWNAIFSDRQVPVKKAEILVHLPEKMDIAQIKQRLFIGLEGSKIQSQNFEVVDEQTVRFWGDDIAPGDFLTIVVAWPKGMVKKPLLYRNQIINWLILVVGLVLPMITFVKMYGVWQRKGKDPKIEKTIMAHYAPPENLSPAIFGVLIDQKIDMKDIVATLVDLAVRGYLRIVEGAETLPFFQKKEYIFEKIKDEGDLKTFERRIMKAIFDNKSIVSTQKLRNKFYQKIPQIKKLLHKEVERTGYFTGNIENMRKEYSRVSNYIFLFVFLLFFVWIISAAFLGTGLVRYFAQMLILSLSLVICAIIIHVFAYYMPSVTPKGLEAKWKLLGFKDYLYKAERFRLDAETLDTFSKFLPFAIVLGVETKWAQRFVDFPYEQQDWYVPALYAYSGGRRGRTATVSFNDFSASISSFCSSISRTFGPAAGRGAGGGFGAGGGAGGGGGGGGGGAG